ncbi:MAG: DsbA family protein [Maritimibacter sp.]
MTRFRFAPTLALTTSLLGAPAVAGDITEMTEEGRAVFREEVRAYLLDNPEVLMEAIGVLERRQAEEQVAGDASLVATNAKALFEDGYSHVGGNPEGDVTIVEFVDYRCGYCRKAFPELQSMVEADGNIRVIYKEFPILGADSIVSARFAMATQIIAGEDGYALVHDELMTLRGNPTEETLVKLANDLDLDGAAILAAMDDPKVEARISENHALADRLQISGTPTFVIGQQMVRGYVPLDGMVELVQDVRMKSDG